MTMTDEHIRNLTPERTIIESGANASDFGAALSFDRSRAGRKGVILPPIDVPQAELPEEGLLRDGLRLPEMAQNDVIRYFLGLSRLNYSVDTGFYPLGSCTMKYNPKINEDIARLPGFAQALPQQPEGTVQGALAALYELQSALAEITEGLAHRRGRKIRRGVAASDAIIISPRGDKCATQIP